MKIELKTLILKDFKGIKDLTIDFSEKAKIYGKNESGKTTIFNAYMWLLWGKDSKDRKDYEIKPYDGEGENIHNLETIVEGVFLIDGESLRLKRVYKEKWTKKRGSVSEEFTGHTTDFYINDVPKKLKDYNEYIGNLLSEEDFKLLSNPLYFNEILNNKERREILINLVDEVSPSEIVYANRAFEKLDLENYSIEELQAMAKSSSKKINDDLKEIPARIDELSNMRVDLDFSKLEAEKEAMEKSIEKLDKTLADTSNVSEVIKEKSSKISVLETEKRKLISAWQDENQKGRSIVEYKRREVKRKIDAAKFEIENKTILHAERVGDIARNEGRAENLLINLENLRKKWVLKNKETYQGDFICPTCKQDLPKDKILEIKENFNLNKSKDLEDIQKNADKIKLEVEEYRKSLYSQKKDLESLDIEIEQLIKRKKELEKELESIEDFRDLEEPKELELIDQKIKKLEKELKEVSVNDNTSVLTNKKELKDRLEEVTKSLANKGLNKEIDKKIKNYEEEEKKLAKEYEKQEEILYLCEEYIKAYVEKVSEKINNLFDFAKFKLFESQINGGIKETAEATYDGVPYGALNNAATINIGLDIINTLSNRLDKYVPIFIDNAESVNKILDVDSQTVELIVSNDEELIIK